MATPTNGTGNLVDEFEETFLVSIATVAHYVVSSM